MSLVDVRDRSERPWTQGIKAISDYVLMTCWALCGNLEGAHRNETIRKGTGCRPAAPYGGTVGTNERTAESARGSVRIRPTGLGPGRSSRAPLGFLGYLNILLLQTATVVYYPHACEES